MLGRVLRKTFVSCIVLGFFYGYARLQGSTHVEALYCRYIYHYYLRDNKLVG